MMDLDDVYFRCSVHSDNLSRMITRNMSPVHCFKVAVRQTSYAGKKRKHCHKLAQVYLKGAGRQGVFTFLLRQGSQGKLKLVLSERWGTVLNTLLLTTIK